MTPNFTGLVATYLDGTIVEEKNYFYSEKLKRECATNWAELDLEKLKSLELYYKGSLKAKVSKEDHPHISADDWVFSHTGIADMGKTRPKTIARNIGYKQDGMTYVSSVDEETGAVSMDVKKS